MGWMGFAWLGGSSQYSACAKKVVGAEKSLRPANQAPTGVRELPQVYASAAESRYPYRRLDVCYTAGTTCMY